MKTKRETRILISKCYDNICLGIIKRDKDIDGAVSGKSCKELCLDAEKRGYMGELRYAIGDCRCGLPIPRGFNYIEELQVISSKLPIIVERYRKLVAGKI